MLSPRVKYGLGLLVVVSVLLQFAFALEVLDNGAVNKYAPDSHAAVRSVEKAEMLAEGGTFGETFADGTLMPGYALFVSLFYVFDQPLLLARLAQILLATAVIPLFFASVMAVSRSTFWALCGAALCSLWLPFYYYAPILLAETCSIFLVAVLWGVCARLSIHNMYKVCVVASFVIAALTYLKPNHAILIVPFLVYSCYVLYVVQSERVRRIAGFGLLCVVLVTSLVAPWSFFLSQAQGRFVLLGTNQGKVLYQGAGLNGPTEAADGTLPKKVGAFLRLHDAEKHEEARQVIDALDPGGANTYYQALAMDAWRERPWRTAVFGLSKFLHALGFSFRGTKDTAFALQFVTAALASVFLWRVARHREWCLLFWCMGIALFVQAFVFIPDMRFRIVYLDFPALLMIVLALSVLMKPLPPAARVVAA